MAFLAAIPAAIGAISSAASAAGGLSTLATAASVAGTAIGVVGALQQGQMQREAYKMEAVQAEQRANEARAAAARQQYETRRKTDLVQSRVRAVAAASGASTTDAGTLGAEQSIAERGEYSALMDWAQGENRARGFEDQASAALYKGKVAEKSSYFKAAGTLFDGIGTFAKVSKGVNWGTLGGEA